ncbi:putative reverse transcriptase domain-containing protein, partial [Tanacetum coccineum]
MDDAKEIWAAIKTRFGGKTRLSNWDRQTTDEELTHALMAFTVINEWCFNTREQEDIDDSLYEYGKHGPQPKSPSPTESNASSIVFSICPSNDSDGELGTVSNANSTVYSSCQSNDSDGEQGTVSDHSVHDDPTNIPSIEQVTIVTQKTQPQVPKPQQTVDPSCAQHVKTPRQPIRTPVSPTPIPSNNRQNWNHRMERELGAGYSFERKSCFVCGSLSHLIKDCDYYEKKMAKEAAFQSKRVIHANVRQATPAWTNSNRVNKANQFTPRPVQLNNIRPNFSTASRTIKTGRVNVNTGKQNVSSGRLHVSSGTHIKSGTSSFNTGKQHVNSGSIITRQYHQPDYHSWHGYQSTMEFLPFLGPKDWTSPEQTGLQLTIGHNLLVQRTDTPELMANWRSHTQYYCDCGRSMVAPTQYLCDYWSERIMPPKMRTRSAGRPVAESRGGGTGERVGRGGRGKGPRGDNDEHVDELNGHGNDQGIGANGGVEGVNRNVEGVNGGVGENVRNVLVNGNRVGCSYKEFLACNPKEYDGKGGVVVLTRWIEKMKNVQDMSGCSVDQKVKYTAGSLVEEFCPSHEMQKLETELWNHAIVGAGHAAYTDRFHELARLVPHLISGVLTDEAVRNGSIKKVEKRGNMGEPSKDKNGRDDNKRTKTRNAFASTTNLVGRENMVTWPKCTTCNSYHAPGGPCRTCFNCNRPSHLAKDCRGMPRNVNPVNARNPTARVCYECGSTDHVKSACPRLHRAQEPGGNHPNQVAANNGGQGRGNQGNQAKGRAFMLGAEEARQDPNIVM